MAKNHVALGVAAWCLIAAPMGVFTFTTAAVAAAGSLLPDIDHPKSQIANIRVGRIKPLLPVALVVSALVGHRGVTHSLIAVVALLALLIAYTANSGMAAHAHVAALVIGYLSHIAGDSLTPSGVPLLWPRSKTYSVKMFRTNSIIETIITWIICTCASVIYFTQK